MFLKQKFFKLLCVLEQFVCTKQTTDLNAQKSHFKFVNQICVFHFQNLYQAHYLSSLLSAKCTELVMINWSDISALTQTLSPVDQMCLLEMMSTHTPPL